MNTALVLDQVQIPLSMSYTFPTGRIRPMLQAGIRNTFTLEPEVQHSIEANRERLRFAIGAHQLSAFLGLGLVFPFDRMELALHGQYEFGANLAKSGVIRNNNLTSTMLNIEGCLGIRFPL